MPQGDGEAGAQALATGKGENAVDSAPELNRPASWSDLLGPLATPRTVRELMVVSRGALDGARRRGAVLGIRTSNGTWLYPLRQFRGAAGSVEVLPGLPEVLRALYESGDSAGAARWLATPNRRLGGACPWDQLTEGGRTTAVVAAAQAQSAAWSGV